MTAGERGWPDDRRDAQRPPARREAPGLTGWLRKAIAPRPREVWVMEPDGSLRRVSAEC